MRLLLAYALLLGSMLALTAQAAPVDLTDAVVVVRPGTLPKAEAKAAVVLVEEVQKRTGLQWPVVDALPGQGTAVALATDPGLGIGAEGYRITVEPGVPTLVRIAGADPRGVLYGVGRLLRELEWAPGSARLPEALDVTTAPAYRWRGHQLGYRNRANCYDAWDPATYEQYIRELIIFGANAVENIPFQDPGTSPHNPIPRAEMNVRLSEICDDYGIEYWVWTPVEFDLASADSARIEAELDLHEALYEACPRLDGVFVPGGDPGNNPPDLLLDFLEDLHARLVQHHPEAGVYVSNQGFNSGENDDFFDILQTEQPDYIAGVVFGPGTSLTLEDERNRTPAQYPIRHYPDITHSVRSQYPVFEWDRAYAHTENREVSNPRPEDEAWVHNTFAPFTDGFISYSDGAHDDVNKQVWSMRGWDPDIEVDAILADYARFFFGSPLVAETVAGIRELEQNWAGPLAANTAVDETFDRWQRLETENPGLGANWRWQFLLLRAYYDFYIQERLAYETGLEEQALSALATAPVQGAGAAIVEAQAILEHAVTEPVRPDLRIRIEGLCAALFNSIGYQSSMNAPYFASDPERSAVLDFVDWPLNNRYWYDFELPRILGLGSEPEKLAALDAVVHWEDPGPGGFYDDPGHLLKQPHVVTVEATPPNAPGGIYTLPGFFWHAGNPNDITRGGGRLAWQDYTITVFGQPFHMRYTGLAPDADYTVKVSCVGRAPGTVTLRGNGVFIATFDVPTAPPFQVEHAIPLNLTAGGTLDLTWERTSGSSTPISEVWLTTPDNDDDGLPDYWQARYGLGENAGGDDTDGDGLDNVSEFEAGTDPTARDTDGDAYWDNIELARGSDPGDGGSVPASSGVPNDIDLDGAVNAVDVQLVVNGVLGIAIPYPSDVNGDQATDAGDVQSVVNSVLGVE